MFCKHLPTFMTLYSLNIDFFFIFFYFLENLVSRKKRKKYLIGFFAMTYIHTYGMMYVCMYVCVDIP